MIKFLTIDMDLFEILTEIGNSYPCPANLFKKKYNVFSFQDTYHEEVPQLSPRTPTPPHVKAVDATFDIIGDY